MERIVRELLTEDQSKRFQGRDRVKKRAWREKKVMESGNEDRKKLRNKQEYKVEVGRENQRRWKRIEGRESRKGRNREELVIKRERMNKKQNKERRRKLEEIRKRKRKEVRKERERLKGEKEKTEEVNEWKEEVVRVGTGYRVRRDEKDKNTRRFDVGYSDRKKYTRKEGRKAIVDQSSIGRTVRGKGKDARVKVMNAVSEMEKRRRVSEYTGSGIIRKSRVGKRKLKPTKPQAK